MAMAKAFVIQHHSGYGPEHFDMMFEQAGSLATWQFSQSPLHLDRKLQLAARRIQDHRPAYLTYEGPVSGNRGRVSIIEQGSYHLISAEETRWEVELEGQGLIGRFELIRLEAEPGAWLFRPVSAD
jgi:hypothetical protein